MVELPNKTSEFICRIDSCYEQYEKAECQEHKQFWYNRMYLIIHDLIFNNEINHTVEYKQIADLYCSNRIVHHLFNFLYQEYKDKQKSPATAGQIIIKDINAIKCMMNKLQKEIEIYERVLTN